MNAESNHELGARPLVLVGKATTDGTFNARAKATVTEQVATTQGFDTCNILMTYVHKVSKKVMLLSHHNHDTYFFAHNQVFLATEFRLLFQYSVRENVDYDGVACGLVESGMRTGKIILSAKMADLKKRDVVFECGYL
ncbi:unnamed protein product [Arabidopsis halleri]